MKDPVKKVEPQRFKPFIYPVKKIVPLSRSFKKRNKKFIDVLLSRRSDNNFSKVPVVEISELLYLSTKISDFEFDDFDFLLTKRTTPSAGARHPIDLLVSPAESISKRALHYYNPIDHTLGELISSRNRQHAFFEEVDSNLSIKNACIIWFSIQSKKTGTKYLNPESLYWRDAGALIYCIQLISTYLGYKSCPVGTLCSHSFYELFENKDILSGGGILVGQ